MRAFWPRKGRAAWSPLRKPLSQSTLALVCSNAYLSGAWHRLGPFEHECRFRSVGAYAYGREPAASRLDEPEPAQLEDERLLSILSRVHTLVDSGRLGRLSPRHLSLSGAVVTSRRLIAETRHTAVPLLVDDHVDVALLVPT